MAARSFPVSMVPLVALLIAADLVSGQPTTPPPHGAIEINGDRARSIPSPRDAGLPGDWIVEHAPDADRIWSRWEWEARLGQPLGAAGWTRLPTGQWLPPRPVQVPTP